MAKVSFDKITLIGSRERDTGKLSLFPGFVRWRQVSGHRRSCKLKLSEFQKVTFLKVSESSWRLDILMTDETFFSFSGFINTDKDKAATFFRDQGMPAVEDEVSLSGRNFGDLELTGNSLSMIVDNKTAFRLDLDEVSNVKTTSKNDITIQFHSDGLKIDDEMDNLLEMSFHIPETNRAFGVEKSVDPAQTLKHLLESNEGSVYSHDKAAAVVEFDSLEVLNLSGPCNLKLHLKRFILEHKKTNTEIEILYKRVVSLIVCKRRKSTVVILATSPSFVMDQTVISDIMIKFDNNLEVEKKMNVQEVEKLKRKVLENSYKGIMHDVFTRIFGRLAGVVPLIASGKFVKSSYKTYDGYLYMLEDSILFVPTRSVHIPHDEVLVMKTVPGSAEGTYDLVIVLDTEDTVHFTQIKEDDIGYVREYIKSKELGTKAEETGTRDE